MKKRINEIKGFSNALEHGITHSLSLTISQAYQIGERATQYKHTSNANNTCENHTNNLLQIHTHASTYR